MEYVCPICNSLYSYIVKCPNCGRQMEDMGVIQDYLDDYSPYLSMDITQKVDGAPATACTHLFYCVECKNDKRVAIEKILI